MRSRLAHLDAIKVLLVVGVIAMHSAITYGLDGSWYLESYDEMPTAVVAAITIRSESAGCSRWACSS